MTTLKPPYHVTTKPCVKLGRHARGIPYLAQRGESSVRESEPSAVVGRRLCPSDSAEKNPMTVPTKIGHAHKTKQQGDDPRQGSIDECGACADRGFPRRGQPSRERHRSVSRTTL